MSIVFSKKNTVTLIGAIIFCSSLLIGCGNKMPGKVYKINEINYSEKGDLLSENHITKKFDFANVDLSYYSYDKDAKYSFDGKLIQNANFIYYYNDFTGVLENFAEYDPVFAAFKIEYDSKSKKITVKDLENPSHNTAIYEYDDSGKLVHYKSTLANDIWLQYDYWENTKKIKKVTWYSKKEYDTDLFIAFRWLYQWDYFYNYKFK